MSSAYLNRTAEYALRAMTWLATLPPDTTIRANELSLATNVPLPYLSKVMRRLVVADLVASQKGHGGGFTLTRPAREIRLSEVIAAAGVEDDGSVCAFGWGRCNSAQPCPMHGAWADLKQRIDSWAADTTLAEVSVSGDAGKVRLRRPRPG